MAALKDKGCTDCDLNTAFGTDNCDSSIMAFFKGIVPFITTHLKKSRRGRHI